MPKTIENTPPKNPYASYYTNYGLYYNAARGGVYVAEIFKSVQKCLLKSYQISVSLSFIIRSLKPGSLLHLA